jgi:hypothetical protein
LCVDVLEAGFVKEEVMHQMVVVEETPVDHIRSRGEDYISGSAYNYSASIKDELLCCCFEDPFGDVRHMLLSHNHVLLILRAFLAKCKWEMPPNPNKNIIYSDSEGRLSLTADAGSPNGKELAEVVMEGLDCEVLSWKMDLEEPTAASIISQSLNKAHEVALRTTELTALSVLRGEIIVQMGKDVSQRVAFQTVKEKVRMQLDAAVDYPDLPELFDFLINAGVGRNTYLQDLFDFASCFVDSKTRQLRFSAFGIANKIHEQAPLTKIAVMKRTYRKKPCLGFCPNPKGS